MISIRVVSRAGEAPAAPLVATFGAAGGDIGRGVDCTLVLPDPERRISRKHALVTWRDGTHFIRQLGVGVAVELDGRPLAVDSEQPLADGSELRIGPYLLRAAAVAPVERPPPHAGEVDLSLPPTPRMSEVDLSLSLPPTPRPGVELDLVLDDAEPPDGFVRALYEGLGVPAPAAPSAEQARLVGALLRAAVAGTLELLAARHIAKRELGASPTLLQTRQNNPLKFSPDADAALGHLLGPAQRGFIPPLAAVTDAFDDLRAHEMAVLAGMRAALDAVLARFDPAALEQRLAPKGMLPGARKARLWEGYAEQYAHLLREIEGDFDSLFGRAFLQAYEAQLAQFAPAKKVNPDAAQ